MNTPNEIRHVVIETIPHNLQRYDTVGDYFYGTGAEAGQLEMKVSDMGDWRFGMACAVHELVEASLLVVDRVSEGDVSAFDEAYEAARQETLKYRGKHAPIGGDVQAYRDRYECQCVIDDASEPGEDRHAPYRKQHAVADAIERTFAAALGIVWKDYEEKVVSMVWRGGHDPYGENGEASEDADDQG